MRGFFVLLIGCCALGCAENDPPKEVSAVYDVATDPAERKVTEVGPVVATVSIGPPEPRIGDPLTLLLEVEAVPGIVIEMPSFGEALGRFSIVDFTPRMDRLADGSSQASQRYTLQAPMSGTQRIPRLRVEFLDERDGASREYQELLTEELSIDVASVIPEGAVVTELRPALGVLPELGATGFARWWPYLAGLAVVVLGAGAAFVAWQRRSVERVQMSAYDRATRRLQALESRGLPSGAEADAWYVELSDIVRRYIEDRYQVRAPELTTEEFLTTAQRSAELSLTHRELLEALLERCDRVKFAQYDPEEAETRDAMSVAQQFLEETRLEANVLAEAA